MHKHNQRCSNKKKECGATIIEFAIIASVLFLLFLSIVEFAILFFNKALLNNACREGARTACLYDWPEDVSATDVESAIKGWCEDNLINFGNSKLTIEFPPYEIHPEEVTRGDTISVRIVYPYHFLFLPFGSPLDLTAEHIMRKE